MYKYSPPRKKLYKYAIIVVTAEGRVPCATKAYMCTDNSTEKDRRNGDGAET